MSKAGQIYRRSFYIKFLGQDDFQEPLLLQSPKHVGMSSSLLIGILNAVVN